MCNEGVEFLQIGVIFLFLKSETGFPSSSPSHSGLGSGSLSGSYLLGSLLSDKVECHHNRDSVQRFCHSGHVLCLQLMRLAESLNFMPKATE
jgi:hypothetical protein